MSGGDEGVLSRWSRLKRSGGEAGDEPEIPTEHTAGSPAADPVPDDNQAPAREEDGERMLTEEDLPDIDGLSYESDFSAFMQKNVPDYLHRMAMRKLWTSDPVLANLDGLNDYDLDYTIEEVREIAAQSAEDLLRGTKRSNTAELRAREREAMQARVEPAPAEAAQGAERLPEDGPSDNDDEGESGAADANGARRTDCETKGA